MKGISEYKKKIRFTPEYNSVNKLLKSHNINTICHSAGCPNIGECFSQKKLTFLILGNKCARNCAFCNVESEKPGLLDREEPERIAIIAKEINLKYAVITSVTRDDLKDGGAFAFLDTVERLKQEIPDIRIEILIPDFQGDKDVLKKIVSASVDVIGHNIETIERIYPDVRKKADFNRSLEVLKYLRQTAPAGIRVKSGFMTGLGENMEEIKELLKELYNVGVDILTVGQYFQPSSKNIPAQRAYTDREFEEIREYGLSLGIKYISSGRFVRSSYNAEKWGRWGC